MRTVFQEPIEKDEKVLSFEQLLYCNRNGIKEETIASLLEISGREVRKIAERLNKRKYMNHDNRIKYHVLKVTYTDGTKQYRYFRITKESAAARRILEKRKWDAIAAMKAYKMYLDDWQDYSKPQQGMQVDMIDSIIDILESDQE